MLSSVQLDDDSSFSALASFSMLMAHRSAEGLEEDAEEDGPYVLSDN